jgi:hypothetical protein
MIGVQKVIAWGWRIVLTIALSGIPLAETNAFSLDGFYNGMSREEAEAVATKRNLIRGETFGEAREKFSQYTLTFCGPKWDRLNGIGKQIDDKEFEALFLDYAANFGNPWVDVPEDDALSKGLFLWLRWRDLPNGDSVQMSVFNSNGVMQLSFSVHNNSPCKEG